MHNFTNAKAFTVLYDHNFGGGDTCSRYTLHTVDTIQINWN